MKYIIRGFFRKDTLIYFVFLIAALLTCFFFALNIYREEATHSEKVIATCVKSYYSEEDYIDIFNAVATKRTLHNIFSYSYAGETYEQTRNTPETFFPVRKCLGEKVVFFINPDNPSDVAIPKTPHKIALLVMVIAALARFIYIWHSEADYAELFDPDRRATVNGSAIIMSSACLLKEKEHN